MERLPNELIYHIIDLVVEASDRRSLHQLSLVDKAFSVYARQCLFQDLSIKTCPEIHIPWCVNRSKYVGACDIHCIKELAPVLKARAPASTIPRTIRTLTLDGSRIIDDTFSFQEIEEHTGGMDDERVTAPVLGYFEAVQELRLLHVPLYPFSYWALFRWRPLTLLSSVRTLVLDNTRFYGGPPALHSFISRMPNLQSLYMNRVRWAGKQSRWPGYPDDVPGWAAILEGSPTIMWSQTVRETMFPQQRKPIPSSPSHLILHLEGSVRALSWIMMPMLSEMLSKLSSLEVHTRNSGGDDVAVFLLRRLLASVPSVVDLTFSWHHTCSISTNLFHPDLSLCTSLRTLRLQLMCKHERTTWPLCREWLHSAARSIRDSPSLQHVQVTMDDPTIDDMSR
ncbi:hypothetical protein CPB85DRAFT_1311192 [Mucidula mucida]|nr:hypothetical protein CPB85DRAFT_1311192 [Mucidula mucida]